MALLAAACSASPDNTDGFGYRSEVLPPSPEGATSPTTTKAPGPAGAPAATFRLPTTSASIGGCQVFPPDHYMNATNIDTLPVHPRSSEYLSDLGGADAPVRFTTSKIWEGARGGTPINVVDSRQTGFSTVNLNMWWTSASYTGGYPIPTNPRVQGYPSAQWDKHLLIVDAHECMAYELIQYDPAIVALTGIRSALAGMRYPLNSTEMTAITTNAPLTPMIGQFVMLDEVRARNVPHVLAFCSNRISQSHVWPARRSDGTSTSTSSLPMGAWLRLKAGTDTSHLGAGAKSVANAMRTRGVILTDSCPYPFSLMAENSSEWNDADLQTLRTLDATDFEVVDANTIRADTSSYRIR